MSHPEIKGRDIVVISIQPWYYELGSNCKNIATHLSINNRVLYVNMPITRRAYVSNNKTKGLQKHCDIIKNNGTTVEAVKENLWEVYPTSLIESINWLPHTSLFRPINKINNRRFANNIKTAIKKLNFQNILLFNDNDIYNGFHLKELLQPDLYIYYMRDFLQGYDFCKRHTSVLEPELIKKADLAVTNSTYYAEYCSRFNAHSTYIGQGCNLELFQKEKLHTIPPEISKLKRPVIGYTGALDSTRLDHSVLKTIALYNPDWQIVLVGPEDDAFVSSDLHHMPNVHFLGRKPIEALPAFVNSFDVCINPQLINVVTMGNYPLKIDEYLALGKPVVATKTSAMSIFHNYTYLANTPEEYPQLILRSLSENSSVQETARIKFARSHTWENSIKELYSAIKKHVA
jgi:teichuronic acid biosynthesis glycosyltransferase TuaH